MGFLFFIFGLIIGSFLNVIIYRIPRKISILFPPSFCPNCKKGIKPYDNIPILSYIILRGRCRYCQKKISLIYPLVELITGIVFYGLYLRLSLSLSLLFLLIYFSLLILIGLIDWQEKLVYDLFIYLGIVLGFLFNIRTPLFSVLGVIVGSSVLFLLRSLGVLWKKKEMLGPGDIFLGAMIGSLLGWKYTLLTIFVSSLFGLVISIGLIFFNVWKRGEYLPFGSFLSLGTGVIFFFGEPILYLYLHLFSFWG